MRQRKLFNIYGATGGNFAGNVYDPEFISPALSTMGGGNQQPIIITDMQEYDSIYYNQSPDFVRPPSLAQYQQDGEDGQSSSGSNS